MIEKSQGNNLYDFPFFYVVIRYSTLFIWRNIPYSLFMYKVLVDFIHIRKRNEPHPERRDTAEHFVVVILSLIRVEK